MCCFRAALPAGKEAVAKNPDADHPSVDEAVAAALKTLPAKPSDNGPRDPKQKYSQKVSEVVAVTLGGELRRRGMREARPAAPGELDASGAERRMAGGIGAKKVDVTWATEESGLLLGISVKSINFKDKKSGNYQKNLTNRRGDMLMEAVTLHRRFPYAVLAGFFFLDKGASGDQTRKRRSTLANAHSRLKLFTGRADPADRDEQYERLYLVLMEATPFSAETQVYEVGKPDRALTFVEVFDELARLVAERNPDFYEEFAGRLTRVTS